MTSTMSPEMEKNIRKGWDVDDWVEVFSKSRNEWLRAKIIEVYTDNEGEWLAVAVQDKMVKEVQRFHPDVRPLRNDFVVVKSVAEGAQGSDDDHNTNSQIHPHLKVSNNVIEKRRRRRSVIDTVVHVETLAVNDEQATTLRDQSFLAELRAEFETFGKINYDDDHTTLQVLLKQAQLRDDGIKLLEEHLGSKLTSYIEQTRQIIYKELRFPLSNIQIDLLTDAKKYDLLSGEMEQFGTIKLDENDLVLKMRLDDPSVFAIHKLEKRLGTLLQNKEVQNVMDAMNFDWEDVSNPTKQQEFFNKMMNTVTNGTRMIKHKKRDQPSPRWILVDNDRLFWKKSQEERNRKSKSLHWTKIIQIMAGKNTRALKDSPTSPEECCFSIIASKVTVDFECDNADICNTWVHYLKALHKHFQSQADELKAHSEKKSRFSGIGLGFKPGAGHGIDKLSGLLILFCFVLFYSMLCFVFALFALFVFSCKDESRKRQGSWC